MRRHMLYLVGRPAAGKSTLAAAITAGIDRTAVARPIKHDELDVEPYTVELGTRRETFSGTDTLPMSVITPAKAWLTQGPRQPTLVLAEGDRLATPKFWDALRAAGWSVTVCYVDTPAAVVETRRADRSDWNPNPTWLKGRDSKAARLRDAATLSVPGNDIDTALDLLVDDPLVEACLAAARP